jgi:RNA polymerase sigma-70 factor (ECF subfamily)
VDDAAVGPITLDPGDREFSSFFEVEGRQLRRALVATYGVEVGSEVANDALAWAWAHWERVRDMDRPVGYLYRVGQSAARRHHRWQRTVDLPPELPRPEPPESGPALDAALADLKPAQRAAVLLIHGYGWSYAEAAEATSSSVASVRNNLHRAMRELRRRLEVS